MSADRTPSADLKFRDHLLDALTFSSGAVDAITFLAFGRIFTAFMTGNIVFLGLRTAGSPSAPAAVPLLAALAGFILGVFLTTRIITPDRAKGTWPREVTVALGLSLIFQAVALVIWFAVDGQPSGQAIPLLLAVWAIAMGMQSGAVRALRVDGVFTTAVTGAVIILAADIASWPATGVERRRLLSVLLSLFVGATAGGLLLLRAHIYAPILPFVVTVGVVVTAARVWGRAPSAQRRTPVRA